MILSKPYILFLNLKCFYQITNDLIITHIIIKNHKSINQNYLYHFQNHISIKSTVSIFKLTITQSNIIIIHSIVEYHEWFNHHKHFQNRFYQNRLYCFQINKIYHIVTENSSRITAWKSPHHIITLLRNHKTLFLPHPPLVSTFTYK